MIEDPWFYAVAVPAVLLTGLAKSGFLSGFGSLAVPLMAMSMPVPQAAAILLPLLLVMDVVGIQRLWRDRDPALLRQIVPAGLVGVAIGTGLFGLVSVAIVSALVGALTLLFLAQRLLFPPRADRPALPGRRGWFMAVASGFTSFVAHAGAPPLAAYLLPLRLPPVRVAATMAVYFGIINLVKTVPYTALGLFDTRNLLTALVLAPFAPLGVWAGAWLTPRISADLFYRLGYAGMGCTGLKLLWDGLR